MIEQISGIQAFDALRTERKMKKLPSASEFPIHPLDAIGLCKLDTNDLESRGFDSEIAEVVVRGFNKNSLVELGLAIGLRFKKDSYAKRLLS